MTIVGLYLVVALALWLIYGLNRDLTPLGRITFSATWPLWGAVLVVLTPLLWVSERFARRYYPPHVWRHLDGERVKR